MLDGFTAPLIDKYPNTYTFTKSLAEYLIEKESVNLPFMIVRPSIVSSSISDPFPVSSVSLYTPTDCFFGDFAHWE